MKQKTPLLLKIVCVILALSGMAVFSASIYTLKIRTPDISVVILMMLGILLFISTFGLIRLKLWGFLVAVVSLSLGLISGIYDLMIQGGDERIIMTLVRILILVYLYHLYRKGIFKKPI